VNTRKQGSAQDVGADNEPSAASRAAYQDPTAVPLPEEKDCAKIGTVAILGVTGLWQLRTLYLTEDVLWVGHRDTARCLDNFWLVNIRKIKSLDAQDDHDDGMGETMVPDESACCFSLYVKCASTGEEPHLELELDAEDDKHDVKIMCIRTLSSEERDQWMSSLEESVEKAKAAELARRPPPTCQQRLSDLYNSHICQGLVMTLVITNFSISLAEAEIVPDEGSSLHKTLEDVDIMFTALFAIELAVNMAAHWFWEFWSSSWNWLDFLVVIVSLGSIGTDAGPTIKVIRILRALRVMRLVKRLIALRMIVAAIASSVFPVANVFFLLMLVTIVYAILGVGLFKESSEEFFGNLSRGFFTMFQCVTGDGWASSIARPMMEIADPVGGYDAATAIFFLSYIIIVSWIIVNVVLAVLLDEFLKSSAVEKANITAEQQTFEDLAEIRGPLDPLMRNLSVFRNSDDLYSRISSVFASFEGETVCCDPEHRVKLESVCRGLRALRLSPRLDVSKETILEMWHTFTNGSVSHFGFEHSVKHENPSTAIVRKQGINGMEFEKLMLWQLGKYIERCASKALETADGEPLDPAAATTLLMLKFILAQVGNNVIKDFGNHSSPGPSRKDADEERESGAIYVQASHLLGPGASKRETMTRKNNISFGSNVGLEQKVDVLVSQQVC
jgi:voltage-gated sodium channel